MPTIRSVKELRRALTQKLCWRERKAEPYGPLKFARVPTAQSSQLSRARIVAVRNFPSPVHITSNTTYVASYHTNVGGYSSDSLYFATAGVNSPPLHALPSNSSGGNGLSGMRERVLARGGSFTAGLESSRAAGGLSAGDGGLAFRLA